MKKMIFVILICISSMSYGQVDFLCGICPNGNCNTPIPTRNFISLDITSDFGPRNQGSYWHRGIDYIVHGQNFYGYPVLSPVAGTLVRIDVTTSQYIILSVQDDNQFNHFAYGHVFTEGTYPIVVGDFVFFRYTHQSQYHYAIINTDTDIALSTLDGIAIEYTVGSTTTNYVTTSEVTINMPIAPIGNSGGNYANHVHLYRLVDPTINPQDIDNARNPLQEITHAGADYMFRLGTNANDINNLSIVAPNHTNPIFYNGSERGAIKLVCSMENSNAQPNNSGYYYSVAMDIDILELFIKPMSSPNEVVDDWGELNSNYQLIEGAQYESKICYGARIPDAGGPYFPRYPEHITQSNSQGSSTNQGLIPSAYGSQGATANDYYWFSEIYTRIHEENICAVTDPTLFAQNNSQAKYKDGVYELFFRTTDVEGDFEGSTEDAGQYIDDDILIYIDNFHPYIKEVNIGVDFCGIFPISYFYEAEWNWDNSQNRLEIYEPNLNGNVATHQCWVIEVTPSEILSNDPFDQLLLNIDLLDITDRSAEVIEDGVYKFKVNLADWDYASEYYLAEKIILEFSGKDLNGNDILPFDPPGLGFPYLQPLPIRIGNYSWSPEFQGNSIYDNFHRFNFGCYSGQGKTQGSCLLADFSVNPSVEYGIEINDQIEFINNSSSNAIYYSWDFGNGITSDDEIPPQISYSSSGVYPVTLIVEDIFGLTNSKTIDIAVYDLYYDPPPASFTYSFVTDYKIQFHYNGPDPSDPANSGMTFSWEFGDITYPYTAIQSDPSHTYPNTEGDYLVVLSVANSNGQSMCSEEISINPNGTLSSISCQASDGLWTTTSYFDIDVITNSSNTLSFEYIIDFGDGYSENIFSYSDWISTSHVYQTNGTYLYNIEVWDVIGNTQFGTCSGSVTLGFNPITANFSINPSGILTPNSVIQFNDISSGTNYFAEWWFDKKDVNGIYQFHSHSAGSMGGTINSVFPVEGEYKANLYISNALSQDQKTKYFEIENNSQILPECVVSDFWPRNLSYSSTYYSAGQCGLVNEDEIFPILIPKGTSVCFRDQSYISEECPNYSNLDITFIRVNIKNLDVYDLSTPPTEAGIFYELLDVDDYLPWTSFEDIYAPLQYSFDTVGLYTVSWIAWNDESSQYPVEYDYSHPLLQPGCTQLTDNNPIMSASYSLIHVWDCERNIGLYFDNPPNYIPAGDIVNVGAGTIVIPPVGYSSAIISSQAELNLYVGSKINLRPGFKAESNSKFTAKVLGCETEYGPCEVSQSGIIDENVNKIADFIIEISPNPSEGLFKVDVKTNLSELINYSIYNDIGQKIKYGIFKNKVTEVIDLSKYKSGLYSIHIYINNESYSAKLLKL